MDTTFYTPMANFDKFFRAAPNPISGEALLHTTSANAKTFQELVQQFHQPLYRYYAIHTGGELDHAREMTLATFSIVARKSAPATKSDLASWIFELAWDVLNVHYSQRDSAQDAQSQLDDRQLTRMLKALRSLPFYPREALYLRIFAELSVRDVVAMMDKTETTVKTLVYQGVSEFACRMDELTYAAPSRKQLVPAALTYHAYLSDVLAGNPSEQVVPAQAAQATEQLQALREAVSLQSESSAHLISQAEQILRAASTTRL